MKQRWQNSFRYSDIALQIVSVEELFQGAVILPKHSPLTKMFSEGFTKLRQTGTLDVIYKKWLLDLPTLEDSAEAEVNKIWSFPHLISKYL